MKCIIKRFVNGLIFIALLSLAGCTHAVDLQSWTIVTQDGQVEPTLANSMRATAYMGHQFPNLSVNIPIVNSFPQQQGVLQMDFTSFSATKPFGPATTIFLSSPGDMLFTITYTNYFTDASGHRAYQAFHQSTMPSGILIITKEDAAANRFEGILENCVLVNGNAAITVNCTFFITYTSVFD